MIIPVFIGQDKIMATVRITTTGRIPSKAKATESETLGPNQIIAELNKSSHGDLNAYGPVISRAAVESAEFVSHLTAWNLANGQIRDAKVALPIITLMTPGFPAEYRDNAMAVLATLSPNDYLRGINFAHTLLGMTGKWEPSTLTVDVRRKVEKGGKVIGHKVEKLTKPSFKPVFGTIESKRAFRREMNSLTTRYLRNFEAERGRWERVALQHSTSLKRLYEISRTPIPVWAGTILFGGNKVNGKFEKSMLPPGSVFAELKRLSKVTPQEAASIILSRKIPALIAMGALGTMRNDPAVALALIENATPAQLTNLSRLLRSMGVETNPALRAAYTRGLDKDSRNKVSLLKATQAAAALEADSDEDEAPSEIVVKLKAHQERQLKSAAGIEGRWLVLGDKSPSMAQSVEVARRVAGTLAKLVREKVTLIFFDSVPRTLDVTGLDYDAILKKTATIKADGSGTSIGCGLQVLLDKGEEVDGIVIVSDAEENSAPFFFQQYEMYKKRFSKEVPVYLFRMQSTMQGRVEMDLAVTMKAAGFSMQEFDLRGQNVDYYSIENTIKSLSTNRYGMMQAILDFPLLSLDEVLPPRSTATTTAATTTV